MTFFEMELLLESERLDGCGNSLSNSLESSRTQSSTDDEYDIDMDVQRPEPQKRGRPSSPESRDQTADKRKKQQVVQDRKYSSKKVVGARCYARWSRQNFFWGIITKVSGSGSSREFSVSAPADFLKSAC